MRVPAHSRRSTIRSVRDSRHAQPGGAFPLSADPRPPGLPGTGRGAMHPLSPSPRLVRVFAQGHRATRTDLGFEPRTLSSKLSFDQFLGTEKLCKEEEGGPSRGILEPVIQSPLPPRGFQPREAASHREDIKCQAPPWGHASLRAADHVVSWESGQRARG